MRILSDDECRTRLRELEAQGGMSNTALAMIVLGRDPRTVRRWMAGETIPESARRWISSVKRVERDDSNRVHIVTYANPEQFHKAR